MTGKHRYDHYNVHQNNRQQNQQNQQDHEFRSVKKQVENQTLSNQPEGTEANQVHQQQHQQQQGPLFPPQTSPPINSPYPYSYNQQLPYIPINPYPSESEVYPGSFYPPPTGFIQVPYVSPTEISEAGNLTTGPCTVPPIYPPIDNFPNQYPPVYSQYVYHPSAIYSNQSPNTAIAENCYPPYPAQPYFFSYPPPPVPIAPNITSANPSPNPPSVPTH